MHIRRGLRRHLKFDQIHTFRYFGKVKNFKWHTFTNLKVQWAHERVWQLATQHKKTTLQYKKIIRKTQHIINKITSQDIHMNNTTEDNNNFITTQDNNNNIKTKDNIDIITTQDINNNITTQENETTRQYTTMKQQFNTTQYNKFTSIRWTLTLQHKIMQQ